MTTSSEQIDVHGIPVEVVRKDIKNLHVGVYPPEGRVRVAAPLRVDDEAVRLAVVSKIGWIRRQQASFRSQERQSEREMVTGESHYFQGRRYRLNVLEHDKPPTVQIKSGSTLELSVRPGSDQAKRQAVLDDWHRRFLRERIAQVIHKWARRVGVEEPQWGIKKMKTKWGSCNPNAKRIWLNLELSKKPAACLEYILVHELIHLRQRRHDAAFRQLMDTVMPNWRAVRDELNSAPLGHGEWTY